MSNDSRQKSDSYSVSWFNKIWYLNRNVFAISFKWCWKPLHAVTLFLWCEASKSSINMKFGSHNIHVNKINFYETLFTVNGFLLILTSCHRLFLGFRIFLPSCEKSNWLLLQHIKTPENMLISSHLLLLTYYKNDHI